MSPIPHGRLTAIDLSAVRAVPGVVAVLTAADVPGVNDVGPIVHDDPIFAHETVQFAGQPVFASAAGSVVYAGTGLRGYGKLIIIKHNKTYLSAYAHNRDILVKEGQPVTKGQKIAEMGNTDTTDVKLHFEIRRLGKPMDPARYLPPA